jgi:D-alanyl-D-alanine dipeptidase
VRFDQIAVPMIAVLLCRARVAAASPKAEDWVDVSVAIPDAVIDLRYATDGNITGQVLYPVARCLLRRGVAERLARAAEELAKHDRRLVLWDCYRPRSVQALLWKALPDAAHVAPPSRGSDHSRGAAVDASLADRDGQAIAMPTELDDATSASTRAHARETSADARLLDDAMRAAGFKPLASEWWHFAAPDARDFALSDRALTD